MKKIVTMLLVLALVIPSLGNLASAGTATKAKVSESKVSINGVEGDLYGFNISGSNYFRLRDIARNFSGTSSQFDISWNPSTSAIEIIRGQAYTPEETEESTYYSRSKEYIATRSAAKVLIDGQPLLITAYNIGDSNYVQLRDLGSQIPFEIEYDNASNQIALFSKTPDHAYRVKTAFAAKDNKESSSFPRWKSPVTSYLVHNTDQTTSVIEANQELTIETYNAQYELVNSHKLALELPLFGGFYSGEKYNYVAYGQENPEQNDAKEVIRIVRYDKSFNRVDSVSVKGGESYTVIPFDAGSGRMAEYGDTLVFHTSRERYLTPDGLNHQSQLTIMVNTSTMQVTNDMGRFQKNHVSHSFDQYVLFDGGTQVLVDHGDAYPRSIVLHKGDGASYNEIDLFTIPGAIGANSTGVSIGGFEMSAGNYMVAMNSIDHSKVTEYTSFEMTGLKTDQRDIILSVLPKNDLNAAAVKHITLAKYVGSDLIASIPKLVKISDNKLAVLWQEFDKENHPGKLKYVFVDGNGQAAGEIQTLEHFVLSECSPIIKGDQIVWYANHNGYRMFYSIPLQ
ncbi:hypothetical protein GCM10010912_39650 [Paenibacillus albidus]|uniref:Copper amine oxidase-like N-terminal domain-containing protein n=1 Tax=Paenibacillus albidus TaxID=2041023 RepID=A0A917FMW8_9BACL|nr:hypothetical protein [Paenibacillus albidus]GGF90582.1 hypothetical protein GCM10010912_39650 [Paenibacillus albidus]